jgi:hypothetical protein
MTHLSIPNFWRLQRQRYRLAGSMCKGCGVLYFPQRRICLECGKTEFEEKQLSGKGKIVSWTVIRAAPTGFESPYTIGVVQLAEGPLLTAQIVGPVEGVATGKAVKAVFRRLLQNEDGLIIYGFKFEPEQ